MAKDPAVLWYWNDWNGGTVGMTRHLKGCYMDLLHAQFNIGRLSLAQVKTILGVDFGASWPLLQEKFKKDDNGFYYNEKAEKEKEKRQKFTESRRKNLKSPICDPHMENHMAPHMENENESCIKKGGSGEKWNTRPGAESINLELPELKEGAVIQLFNFTKNLRIGPPQVQGLWKIFKVQNLTGDKYYATENDVFRHFLNWCKTQTVENGEARDKGKVTASAPPLKTLKS